MKRKVHISEKISGADHKQEMSSVWGHRWVIGQQGGHSLWMFCAKASSQQYILMNFMQLKISFISLTRRSVTATHFLRKYAVSLDASICPDRNKGNDDKGK